MKVTLIDYTGNGTSPYEDYAINLLLFTKNTRLEMSPEGMVDIALWPKEKKMKELEYMANTIPSSWEFVHYTFMIQGVTRAFTHQLVRTRTASFAQQTMRVLDVSSGPGWDYASGPTVEGNEVARRKYRTAMAAIDDAYKEMIAAGAAIEDARGILPTNILTNIVMSCSMRTFVELVHKRSSPRTQGEYREVLEAMKEVVLYVHPWMSMFIDRTFDKAAKELDIEIAKLDTVTPENKTKMMKLVDQMRRMS